MNLFFIFARGKGLKNIAKHSWRVFEKYDLKWVSHICVSTGWLGYTSIKSQIPLVQKQNVA